ncbi:hypothetical protein WJX77_009897 [Trebouxia sp. C0004]
MEDITETRLVAPGPPESGRSLAKTNTQDLNSCTNKMPLTCMGWKYLRWFPNAMAFSALAVCLIDLLVSSTLFPSRLPLFPSRLSSNCVVDQSAFCAFGLGEVAMADLHTEMLGVTCN